MIKAILGLIALALLIYELVISKAKEKEWLHFMLGTGIVMLLLSNAFPFESKIHDILLYGGAFFFFGSFVWAILLDLKRYFEGKNENIVQKNQN